MNSNQGLPGTECKCMLELRQMQATTARATCDSVGNASCAACAICITDVKLAAA